MTWAFPKPRNRHETIERYGDPSKGHTFSCLDEDHVDPEWRKANIVELHGDNAIPEIPPRLYYHTHRLVEDEVRAAYRAAGLACPEYKIVSAASWVPRHMRHNPDLPLSVHTFGAADDTNSDQNEGKYIHHSKLPKPWSAGWKDLWPAGLPERWVMAWVERGWSWGGFWTAPDAHGMVYVDPMHKQYGA